MIWISGFGARVVSITTVIECNVAKQYNKYCFGKKQFSDPGLLHDPAQTPIPVAFLRHTLVLTASGQMEGDVWMEKHKEKTQERHGVMRMACTEWNTSIKMHTDGEAQGGAQVWVDEKPDAWMRTQAKLETWVQEHKKKEHKRTFVDFRKLCIDNKEHKPKTLWFYWMGAQCVVD